MCGRPRSRAPPIDVRYPLDHVGAAFSHLESRTQFGNNAIQI